MISQEIIIKNKQGIHARPSSMIYELSNQFKSSITIEYEGKEANASSIMSLILLSIGPNSKITLKVDGPDEKEASKAFIYLLEQQLLEENY